MIINEVVEPTAKKASWIGSLYYLSLFIGAGSYMPFLFVYFSEMGLNGKQIGLLAILSPSLMMLLSMPIATLADRHRLRVRITQLANLGVCIVIFLLQFPKSFTGIVVLMLISAIFNSSSSIAESLVARMAQRHSLNYGTMRLWGSLGYALSALAFGVVWQRLGFDYLFVVASLLFVPLIWFSGRLEEGVSAQQQEAKSVFSLLRDRGLLLLTLATFLSGISNSMAMTFSGIYAKGLGGGNFLVGLMIAAAAFAELPAMFYNERVASYLKSPHTIVLSYALMVLGYLGYIFTPTPNLIPLFSVIKGLGYGLWITQTIRMVTHRTPEHWGATAQSLVTVSIFGLAPLVANPLGGWINDAFGTRAVFWLGVGSLALAAAIIVTAVKYKHIE
ncbi:MAG: MFS transporter [Ardenticatenaceae bacterium]|nr:MFS transporter [Ardenticatenaceae bacterium]MCB9443441.1 MFS transporter [Ardenticatenaceae bacterium]